MSKMYPVDEHTLSYLPFNGDNKDLITTNTWTLDGSMSYVNSHPFDPNGKSMQFGGKQDKYFSPSITNYLRNFGSSHDFTIEFWLYYGSSAQNRMIFASRTSDSGPCAIMLTEAEDGLGVHFTNTNSSWTVLIYTKDYNLRLSNSNWNHCVIEREDGLYKTFINGVMCSQTSTSSTNMTKFTSDFYLGGYDQDGSGWFAAINAAYYNNYLCEFRLSDIAIYKGTNSFDPVNYVTNKTTSSDNILKVY